jgi:hypothetical protein
MNKKILILISLLFLIFSFSGCASWNAGNNIKAQDTKFALAIRRFEFLRHKGVPIVKIAAVSKAERIKTKTKNNKPFKIPLFKISEGSTPKLLKNWKKTILKVKTQVVKQAKIKGNYNGLPVLTVDFINKPLWLMLQNVSNNTGFVFSTQGINLGKKKSIKGRYNLAVLLSKLFVNAQTTVNIKNKRINIKG